MGMYTCWLVPAGTDGVLVINVLKKEVSVCSLLGVHSCLYGFFFQRKERNQACRHLTNLKWSAGQWGDFKQHSGLSFVSFLGEAG